MNKKIYKILILIILFSLSFDVEVFAHSAADGITSVSLACQRDWCYSGMGYRFSLYRYKNKRLKYYTSVDFEGYGQTSVGLSNLNGDVAHIVPSSAGKVAYQNDLKELSWDTSTWYTLQVKSNENFVYFQEEKDFSETKENLIKILFGEVVDGKYSKNEGEILKAINDLFGTEVKKENLSIADLSYLYITVEPTFYIYKKPDADNSVQAYYGTIYELVEIPGTVSRKLGLCSKLYYNWPISIVALKQTGEPDDTNNFVSYRDNALVKLRTQYSSPYIDDWDADCNGGDRQIISNHSYLYSATNLCGLPHWNDSTGDSARAHNISKIKSKEGYGIGVFWVGAFVPEENKDCSSVCSAYSKNSDDRLECAEDYCESNFTNNGEKRDCIISCGYEEPVTQPCNSYNCTSNPNSTCFDSVTANKKTCSYDSNSYIKTDCTTSTTLKYSTELPTVFAPKTGGFNYTLKANGSKTCRLTFNIKNFQFDYAATKRGSDERSILEEKLEYFNNLTADSYIYTSNFEKLNMCIDGKYYNFVLNNQTFDNNISYSNNQTVYLYGNSSDLQTKDKEITSNGILTYELPKQCLMLKSGGVESMKPAGCNDLKEPANYYAYYNLNQNVGRVKVEINAVKNDSCLNDKNECYYLIEEDDVVPTCYLTKDDSGENYIVNINIKNKNDNILSYELNGRHYTYEKDSPLESITIGKSELNKITASITYKTNSGKEVIKSCPLTGNNKCRTLYNSNQYDAIRDYCNKNYLSDGFDNSDACYDYCSGEPIPTKTEYIYRPIALGESTNSTHKYNAFPGREAGSNWQGHEELTLDNSFEKAPIYVIELNSDSIKKIKEDTVTSGKYVYRDFSNYVKDEHTSKLKSNFIKENTNIFTCINGVGEGC